MPDEPSASPPAAAPGEPRPAALAIAEGTGLPRNVAAALAVMIPLIGGLVFLVLEKRDRLVRFYAIQSIVLGALLALAAIILKLAEFIFSPVPLLGPPFVWVAQLLYGIFALAWFIVYVVALAMAFRGKEWPIPYLGVIARRPGRNRDARGE